MSPNQTLLVTIISAVACTAIFGAAFEVWLSNGRTSRAFGLLLVAVAVGIGLVAAAELSASGSSLEVWLIASGRLIQLGGVIYFMLFLRRKERLALTETPGKGEG